MLYLHLPPVSTIFPIHQRAQGLSTPHTLQCGFCDPLSYAASGIGNAPHTAVEARNNSNLSECFPGKRPLGQRNRYEQPAQELALVAST